MLGDWYRITQKCEYAVIKILDEKKNTYLVIKFYLSHQNRQIMNSKWGIIVDFFIYSLTLGFRITVRNIKIKFKLKSY